MPKITKPKPELTYWNNVIAWVENSPVTLYLGYSGYCLTCKLHPNGRLEMDTSWGGGHGEGTGNDSGRSVGAWIDLIKEAEEVHAYYFSGGDLNA